MPSHSLLGKLSSLETKGYGAGERFIEKALELICDSPEAAYDGYHSTTSNSVLFSKSFDWDKRLREFGTAHLPTCQAPLDPPATVPKVFSSRQWAFSHSHQLTRGRRRGIVSDKQQSALQSTGADTANTR